MTEKEFRMKFARRLRDICQERGMNATWIAPRAGISAGSVYAYLNGKKMPNAYRVKMLAKVIGVDENTLLDVGE